MQLAAGTALAGRTEGDKRRRAWVGTATMTLPVLLLFVAVYLLPVCGLIVDSFTRNGHLTLSNHLESLGSVAFWIIVWRTMTLSVVVTAICVLIGYPLAYWLAQRRGRVAAGLLLVVSIPYATSILIRTYAWIVVLNPNGIVNQTLRALGLVDEPLALVFNQVGVYVGMVQVQLPLMVFPLYAAMRRIDRSLVTAARSLGSSAASAFWNVFAPLSVPGIIGGCTLVFLSCLGFYVTPALLGGPSNYLIAQGIYVRVMTLGDFAGAAAQATLLLIVVLIILVVFRRRLAVELGEAIRDTADATRQARSSGLRAWPDVFEQVITILTPVLKLCGDLISAVRRPVVGTVAIVALIYLVTPLLVVIPLAFSNAPYLTFPPPSYSLRWFHAFFANAEWLAAGWFSIKMAGLASVVSLALGVPVAFALVRRPIAGRLILYLLLISPLVVPQVIIAVALYFALATVRLIGTPLAFVLAYAIMGVPYVIVVFVAGLRRFDRTLEMAGANLGAAPLTVLRTVTAPLMLPTFASALLFAFIIGFDDVVMGLFLSGRGATPLPIRMWDNIRLEINPQIAVVAVFLFAALAAAYAIHLALTALASVHRTAAGEETS